MAFLRVEKKKSGTYLRIVETYRDQGKVKHKTLHSLGKVEDYPSEQLERIATKLLELSGARLEDIVANDIQEVGRYNYGYALVIKHLWKAFNLGKWLRKVNNKRKIKFDWLSALELMLAERLNEPSSKLANYNHKEEYLGFNESGIDLHHLYRTLDVLSDEQDSLKKHLFKEQQSLFSNQLDVVFYDVTTLYFDSQKIDEQSIRQKGYSKDGKAHKTQVVLGLLVDKLRNPITYNLYKGNTYEGHTMIDAIKDLKKNYPIDNVIVVADSAMIDQKNRQLLEQEEIDYIIGDRIKNLPEWLSKELINKDNHKELQVEKEIFSYTTVEYKNRTIICTYSKKRAEKDKKEREKLIQKAELLLSTPSKLKQTKKRGAGRFIKQSSDEIYELDIDKINKEAKWDGYKAISTTSNKGVDEILSKYRDLYEVEHAFRSLKSELEIRPMYHWTNKRIEGHVAMCFMAYTMLNYIRNTTGLTQKEIVRTLDKMQVSEVRESKEENTIFLRSAIDEKQEKIAKTLKIHLPKDTTPQSLINQYFT